MTVSDARVSGETAGDCAGDAPTEISTIGDGGCEEVTVAGVWVLMGPAALCNA